MTQGTNDNFYRALTPVTRFSDLADGSAYQPIPDDWIIGVADVVNSTGAIAEGRYKSVNMVGASVISAVMNAIGNEPFPFIFGGDGTGFAVPGSWRDRIEKPFAACSSWAEAEIGLTLRTALVPTSDIRDAGLDVRVARYEPSENVAYAMFDGGGMSWAESHMKEGRYSMEKPPADARPDLSGLSCRFNPLDAENGEIMSLLVIPTEESDAARFGALVQKVLDILDAATPRDGNPSPEDGPRLNFPPKNMAMEMSARRVGRWPILREQFIGWIMQKLHLKHPDFDPTLYRLDVTRNTDFRKFDDGLKLTADCPAEAIEQVEAVLQQASNDGIVHFGIHRQDKALMTCIVPSPSTRDHMHFIDGAAGGYAKAAEMLKASLKPV